ncbi:hypothetical protein IQ266_03125 [filamentous cyanobacterium LEGE 11480]|uniref:Co-chaperone DjlA N-terminal domain-containing protein n=1 Tax=Romeriopsis navalis LEGE 11480 TaxID=2777977 RepID=A0A928VLJ4_9CYAN|nr:hypothetical protein [Romeriopsis navalis]MBE9028750.1 hypothetical protein [Romeriopsis navalis LEGE 11480]
MLETVESQTSQALVLIDQTPQNALISTLVPTLVQTQREAIVDLLLLGMYADRHISVIEQDVLAEEVEKIGWDEFYSFSLYFQRAVPRVRDAIASPARTTQFLLAISQQLDQVDVMKFAIEKFSAMLCLDGSNDAEAQLLDQVMETFFAAA